MFLNILGTEVYYEVLSQGSCDVPIMFLHGWGGSTKSFEYFAKVLSRHRTCILLDFPPFGLSKEPLTVWGLDEYTQVVEEVLKKEGYNGCDIVAHSFGGRVAIHMCERANVNIHRMVLTASAGIRKHNFKRTFRIVKYKSLKLLSRLKLVKKDVLNRMGSKDYLSLSPIMKATFSKIVSFDQRREIKKINAKTLIFWGKNDKDTPFCFTKFFKKHIKDCEVIETDGGHFAYIEDASMFLLCIQSFLC